MGKPIRVQPAYQVKLNATWIIWGGMTGLGSRARPRENQAGVIMLESLIWLKPGENTKYHDLKNVLK